ncbi:hypothetical protein AVEN_144143-1, partial [Araneus ventricosus]
IPNLLELSKRKHGSGCERHSNKQKNFIKKHLASSQQKKSSHNICSSPSVAEQDLSNRAESEQQSNIAVIARIGTSRATPAMPRHPESSEDRSPRKSETETGVLRAITDHGPIPPEGGTSSHRNDVNSTPRHCRQLPLHVLVVSLGRG